MFTSFFKSVTKVITKVDATGDILKALKKLEKQEVLVGIPEEKSSRNDGTGITNAELGYILAHGSPVHNIPPRPFLEPALDANKARIEKQQKACIQCVLNGKTADLEVKKLGMLGQSIVKAWFTDPQNNWPPNAPATIKRKGSDKPLIDTGALRNSISYVVREKNGAS